MDLVQYFSLFFAVRYILYNCRCTGKSAIAAAIQLCLGANTRATGRGANLQGLIREGSQGPAILQVTLYNEGPDAYHPEKYGTRIMVERRIPRSGGASYHIKGNPYGKERFEVR